MLSHFDRDNIRRKARLVSKQESYAETFIERSISYQTFWSRLNAGCFVWFSASQALQLAHVKLNVKLAHVVF